jgi:hypothetical protein
MLALSPGLHAQVCYQNAFQGAYGYLLTGAATMGGTERPVAALGRLVLDGSGNLHGVSSASFMGLIFGNPVVGKYEAHSDCSVTWTLQDGAGGFQHFAGTMNVDASRITFRQTDAGGAKDGILVRTNEVCLDPSIAGSFQLTASGGTINVTTGAEPRPFLLRVLLTAEGRNFTFAPAPGEPPAAAGTYEVQGDCFLKLALELPVGEKQMATMHFRAIVVDEGREVLGIQTDPGTVVALRLVSK